jgi:hypothetical protein
VNLQNKDSLKEEALNSLLLLPKEELEKVLKFIAGLIELEKAKKDE